MHLNVQYTYIFCVWYLQMKCIHNNIYDATWCFYCRVQQQYIKNLFSDLDDPLADLLDDLLPDETNPKNKSSIQRARPGKSAPSPAASPILKTETCEP